MDDETSPAATYRRSIASTVRAAAFVPARAGVDRAPAVEVRESPPVLRRGAGRAPDPGLQIDLGVDLGLALGTRRSDVVAEAALAIGGVDQTDEAVPVTRPPQQAEARVDQMGLTDPATSETRMRSR